MKKIIVYHNRQGILLFESVAKKLNLNEGHQIKTDKEFWKILSENARHGINACNHAINANKRVN